MKISLLQALIVLLLGTLAFGLGVFLKVEHQLHARFVMLGGLIVQFIGSVMLAISLYQRQNSKEN